MSMNDTELQVLKSIIFETAKCFLEQEECENNLPVQVVLGISNKHLHLSEEHVEILFGKGHKLTPLKAVKQPGQFAAKETVKIIGPKGVLPKVRVLGPERPQTQIEVSATDARSLGINPPVRESGKVENSPGVTIEGPEGSVELKEGVIIALRHIHMTPDIAEALGLKDGEYVNVDSGGLRPIIFKDVLVRVSPNYSYEMHLDTDEANAAGLKNDDMLTVLVNQEC